MANEERRTDFGDWIHAWEAGMAENGYPYAQLSIYPDTPYPEPMSYSWTWNVNMFVQSSIYSEQEHSKAYQVAHRVFAAVDHLRPPEISRSIALEEYMTESN